MPRHRTIVAALVPLLFAGCHASQQVDIPPEAELIWLGKLGHGSDVGDFGQATRHQPGQLYLVDDANGRVEGVNSITADSTRVHFDGTEDKKYRLYFIPQPQPATRPFVIQP